MAQVSSKTACKKGEPCDKRHPSLAQVKSKNKAHMKSRAKTDAKSKAQRKPRSKAQATLLGQTKSKGDDTVSYDYTEYPG